MTWHETLTAAVGVLAGTSFVVDYLTGGRWTWRVACSAGGILALVSLLLLRSVLGWPNWVIFDAMGLLAATMFPVWQARMRRLRRHGEPVRLDPQVMW